MSKSARQDGPGIDDRRFVDETAQRLERAGDGGWSPTRKLLASLAVLGAAASIAGLGTFATFTSSTSASHTVSSGTVTIALGATGAATNRLTVGATAIAPGRHDPAQRRPDQLGLARSRVGHADDEGDDELAARHGHDQRPADGDRQVLGRLDGGRPALHVHVQRLDLDRARLARGGRKQRSRSRTSAR